MSYILPTSDAIKNANTGFWIPHSSSVDFCEPNYQHSSFVAETHNVWSSVFISVLAVLGIMYSNPTKEKRNTIMFLTLFCVGIGSVALHATLHWFGQSADEIPMLWLNLSMIYSLYSVNSKKSNLLSALLLLGIGILQTIGYYTMRHVYDFFLYSFISTISIVVCWSSYLVLQDRSSPSWSVRWWLLSRSGFSFLVIGCILWVYEMNHCEQLLPYYVSAGGATFHILWHIGSGLGGYLEILLIIALRIQAQGNIAELDWVFGTLPVIKDGGPKVIHA